MKRDASNSGCGRVLGYFVLCVVGFVLSFAVIPPEYFCFAMLIATPLFLIGVLLFFEGLTRMLGLRVDHKGEVLRKHPLSPWESIHYRMFGGWVCPDCGRLNPSRNQVCYSCSKRKGQTPYRRPAKTGGTATSNSPPYTQSTRSTGTGTSIPPSYASGSQWDRMGRSVMEQLARRSTWTYDRLRRVLIASAVFEQDIPGAHSPDSVDLGDLVRHTEALNAKAAIDGNEWCRAFLVDVEKRTFLQGKTTTGNRQSVLTDWSKEPGREAMQRRSFSIHTHPMAMRPVAQGLSDKDYEGFLWDREQRAMMMVCGDSIMMVLQTSATPHILRAEGIEERLDVIEREARRASPKLGFEQWRVDFNKEVCIQFGLTLYFGGEDGQMKRVHVV